LVAQPQVQDSLPDIETLRGQVCTNMEVPAEYEYPILLAFSFYPEISNCNVIFEFDDIKTTLNARPKITSVFRKKAHRVYVIRINNSKKGEILLSDVPKMAQIGLFSHEFGHITDYESCNLFEVIGRGLSYLFDASLRRFEHRIDNLTIEHGACMYLYSWSFFALYESSASSKYKKFKEDIYMKPDEILAKCNQFL
jgi:hypothetical protein